jgi:hypothetical protein
MYTHVAMKIRQCNEKLGQVQPAVLHPLANAERINSPHISNNMQKVPLYVGVKVKTKEQTVSL